MATGMIRPAKAEDIQGLAALKSTYFKNLFQCFLPPETLEKATPESFVQNFTECLHGAGTYLDLMTLDNVCVAYIVYGVQRDDPSSGWIADAGMDLLQSASVRETTYHHTLSVLQNAGCTQVRQWVLRENFRLRFHMEKLGFKDNGTRRSIMMDGTSLNMAQYVYRLGGENDSVQD